MDNLTGHKASEYDRRVRQTIPFYDRIHAETLSLVKTIHPEPGCWLDTGCGTGSFVQQALLSFPNTRFILADPAEAMLAQARARLDRGDPARLTVLPATDSRGLTGQLAPGTAEVVTAIQCHHYLQPEARGRAVRACFDLLTSGGLLVVFENVAPRTTEGAQIGLKRWKAFQIAAGRSESDVNQHLSRYGKQFFPITVEQHFEVLTQAGFRIVELFWFSHLQAGFYGIK